MGTPLFGKGRGGIEAVGAPPQGQPGPAAAGPGVGPVAWPAEHRLHAHGKAHVALDLQLAAHEGRRRVHLACEYLDRVPTVCQQREVGVVGLALVGRCLPVGNLEEPLAGMLTTEVELDRGVGAARLLRLKVVRHSPDHLAGCELVVHAVLHSMTLCGMRRASSYTAACSRAGTISTSPR